MISQDDDDYDSDDPERDFLSVASSYSTCGTSRKRRAKYSTFELNTILREYHSIIKSGEPIRTDEIEEFFLKNKKLKPILRNLVCNPCYQNTNGRGQNKKGNNQLKRPSDSLIFFE